MSDLIERQAVIDAIEKLHIPEDMCVFEILSHIELAIGTLPSALPERPTGRWIHCDDGSLSFRCSVCGKHAYGCYAEVFSGEYHYCPNCGCKMGVDTDE